MKLRNLLLAALLLTLGASVASAAPPAMPQRLWVSGGDNNNGTLSAYLRWYMLDSNSQDVDQFRIYVSTNGGSTYNFYDTVTVAGDSIGINYSYNYVTQNEGEYYFYVTAENADGESAPTDPVSITLSFLPIRFTNTLQYGDSAAIGVAYTYDFDAVGAQPNDVVHYGVTTEDLNGSNNPEGTIDSITGVFSWTPTEAASFVRFTVSAWLANDPTKRDSVQFYLSAIDPNQLYFTSAMLNTVVDTGETVTHTYHAVSPAGGTLTYGIVSMSNSADIDASIDPNTGFLSLTPHAYQVYQFTIGVYLNGAATPSATQNGYVAASDRSSQPVYLAGAVIDSLHASVYSVVHAYRRTSTSPVTYSEVDSMAGTYFSFRNLPGGTYILYAVPDDTLHTPGYYRANTLASLTWDNATTIVGSGSLDTVVIMLPFVDGQGSNRLRGGVTRSSGRAGLREDSRVLGSAETPLAGAAVYAVDASGRVQGMDVTDANGMYEINRLGVGTFSLLVDQIGFTPAGGTVTFTEDNGATQEHPVHVEPVNSTSGVVLDPVRVERASVAPTPTSGPATLRFEGVSGSAELTVQSTDGRTVQRSAMTTTTGNNLVMIETEGLEAGSYIVRIAMQGRMVTAPLVIVR